MGTRAAVYGRQSRGKEKSIDEQVALCTADAEAQGWAITATYRDRTSASRYRRREREEWARVVAAVAAAEFDILVLWVSSRGDRDLTSWSGLLDTCRASGVLIRITDDERTYDVRRNGDWEALAQQGVGNAAASDKISTAVRRGQAGAASAGRPSQGRCPYGFRRVFDPTTGKLTGQEADPETAPVVREIIERVSKNVPISVIVADLNARGVPTPGARRWYRQRVRDIASNVAYVGLRAYNGQTYTGKWAPGSPDSFAGIVDEAKFYAAQRVLTEPSRVTTRPGRVRHLLSYLGVAPCGAGLTAVRGKYRCSEDGCVTIAQGETDAFVRDFIVLRLSQPDAYASLRQAGETADAEVVKAQGEADELRAQLDRWRRSAGAGTTTPESLAVIEADLTARIRAAERRRDRASLPPALRQVLEPGADVAARWDGATVAARREIIRHLYVVTIGPAEMTGRRAFDPTRIDIKRKGRS